MMKEKIVKNKNIICPSCGASDFEIIKDEYNATETYSDEIKVKIKQYRCKVCGAEGDFTNENDNVINSALEEAKQNALINIIKYFEEHNFSKSGIERALNLPQKTLSKWKNDRRKASAAGLSLMKIIRTYPWILDVADANFNEIKAKEILVKNTIGKWDINNFVIKNFGIHRSGDEILAYIHAKEETGKNVIETKTNKTSIIEPEWQGK